MMRAMRLAVAVLLLAACKGNDKAPKAEPSAPATRPEVKAEAPLPSHFPLPAGKHALVRSASRLDMNVWEYEYADAVADAAKQIADGMQKAGYKVEATGEQVVGTYEGRTYDVLARGKPTTVAIRSFPEAGPATLGAPPSYPTTFPFVAGGTASNTPDGDRLHVAYQLEAGDVESAMRLAAKTAGWTCNGSPQVTCKKDKTTVTFTTEPAPNGSVLVVSVK